MLTYGGVSLFVVAFAVDPVAAALFRQPDLPKRLVPAAIALGSFIIPVSPVPGPPAISNAIPMAFFGATAFAAIRDLALGIGGSVPISLAFAASVLAGMTGSGSGGMTIALQGAPPRRSSDGASGRRLSRPPAPRTMVATGVLATPPHDGAVITSLAIRRLKHGDAYADIAMTGMVGPLVALMVLISLGSLFGSF
ncbi:MAG: hypothetical protein RML45_05745 [Acetobacteraceae bacterium]|nr:hypothetical protein [Acetobacteraceae bacterium]